MGAADRETLAGGEAVDLAFGVEDQVDALDRLEGERRDDGELAVRLGGDVGEHEELAPRMRPASVRTSPGKEDGNDLKPFIVTQRVRRPPGKGGARQPEASLAWVTATSLVKRRQQVLKPCGSLEIM